MGKYYPPTLDSQGYSVSAANPTFIEIYFNLPETLNVAELQTNGHFQVSIRDQSTSESRARPLYSPDYLVIYANCSSNWDNADNDAKYLQIVTFDAATNLYKLRIHPDLIVNSSGAAGIEAKHKYLFQIRFGDNKIWTPDVTQNGLPAQETFNLFTAWRTAAISNGVFGEWSNTQSIYANGTYTATLAQITTKFLPTFKFTYSGDAEDPIEQVQITTKVILNNGEITSYTENYSGDLGGNGAFVLQRTLPYMPTDNTNITLVILTSNKTLIQTNIANNTLQIGPSLLPALTASTNGIYSTNSDGTPIIQGEETGDGVIGRRFKIAATAAARTMDIYRFEEYSRKVVLIKENVPIPASTALDYYIRDYCIEAQEDYIYAGIIKNAAGTPIYTVSTFIQPYNPDHAAQAKLGRIEYLLLTAADSQLRLAGNTTISAFKSNITGAFQTTLGSKYPFYSSQANVDYRTISVSALVTISLDPTFTFLPINLSGQYFDQGLAYNGEIVVPIDDLFEFDQHTLGRLRVKDLRNQHDRIDAIDDLVDIYRGPRSIFAAKIPPGPATSAVDAREFLISNRSIDFTQSTDRNIYVERKFREFAMKWLHNKKPKILRSDTEGNMIVMITDASFTPFNKSRQTYMVSFTATEIAEYTLENLKLYGLIPSTIIPTLIDFEQENIGDLDPYQDNPPYNPANIYASTASYTMDGTKVGTPFNPLLICYLPGERIVGGSGTYVFEWLTMPPANTNLQLQNMTVNGVYCALIAGVPSQTYAQTTYTVQVRDIVTPSKIVNIPITVGAVTA